MSGQIITDFLTFVMCISLIRVYDFEDACGFLCEFTPMCAT